MNERPDNNAGYSEGEINAFAIIAAGHPNRNDNISEAFAALKAGNDAAREHDRKVGRIR